MSDNAQLDDLDRKIVEIMSSNGRMSPKEIADQIGSVTERTIRTRLKSLIDRKLVFTAVILDPRASGADVYAELRLDVDPRHALEVVNAVVDHPLVDWVGYQGSDTDIAAAVVAMSAERVSALAEEFGEMPGVKSIRVKTYLTVLKSFGFRLKAADDLRARLEQKRQSMKSGL
ncbi:Lrp/AsnC family transcriptional regulator [Arenibacterium sp. LLYu02]|uniref:Lrp/AsnC family transcriptional regulator n=1 Tax=Arenibacterium sp. LLYu02 TaxID=3404132 RepID=UPI003B211CA6